MFTAFVTAAASGLVAHHLLKQPQPEAQGNKGSQSYHRTTPDTSLRYSADVRGTAPPSNVQKGGFYASHGGEAFGRTPATGYLSGEPSPAPLPACAASSGPKPYDASTGMLKYAPVNSKSVGRDLVDARTQPFGDAYTDPYSGRVVQERIQLPPPATGMYSGGSERSAARNSVYVGEDGRKISVYRDEGTRRAMPAMDIAWTPDRQPGGGFPDNRRNATERAMFSLDSGAMNDALPVVPSLGERPAGMNGGRHYMDNVGLAPSHKRGYIRPTQRGFKDGRVGIKTSLTQRHAPRGAVAMTHDKSTRLDHIPGAFDDTMGVNVPSEVISRGKKGFEWDSTIGINGGGMEGSQIRNGNDRSERRKRGLLAAIGAVKYNVHTDDKPVEKAEPPLKRSAVASQRRVLVNDNHIPSVVTKRQNLKSDGTTGLRHTLKRAHLKDATLKAGSLSIGSNKPQSHAHPIVEDSLGETKKQDRVSLRVRERLDEHVRTRFGAADRVEDKAGPRLDIAGKGKKNATMHERAKNGGLDMGQVRVSENDRRDSSRREMFARLPSRAKDIGLSFRGMTSADERASGMVRVGAGVKEGMMEAAAFAEKQPNFAERDNAILVGASKLVSGVDNAAPPTEHSEFVSRGVEYA